MLPKVPIIRVTDAEKIPMPSYSDGIGTCLTLRSNEMKSVKIAPKHFEVFSTGFAIALPMGMEAQVRSLKESTQTGVIVLNAPATIDASDRKEIKVCIFNASQESVIIKQGDPIALMVFSMALRIKWVDLTTQRASGEAPDTSYLRKQPITSQKEKEETEAETPDEPNVISIEVADADKQTIIEPISRSETSEQTEPEEQEQIEPIEPMAQELNNDVEESSISTVLSTEPTEELNTNTEESLVLDENSLVEDPVAPPSILEEFEKIENEYEDNQSKGDY